VKSFTENASNIPMQAKLTSFRFDNFTAVLLYQQDMTCPCNIAEGFINNNRILEMHRCEPPGSFLTENAKRRWQHRNRVDSAAALARPTANQLRHGAETYSNRPARVTSLMQASDVMPIKDSLTPFI